jgi:hypothetical protein
MKKNQILNFIAWNDIKLSKISETQSLYIIFYTVLQNPNHSNSCMYGLTCKSFISFIRIESSGSGEEDGGVQISDDAGNRVGRVLQRVGSGAGSVQS